MSELDDGEAIDLFTTITRTEFSPDRKHRYIWQASWDVAKPPLVMCSLNPSTADQFQGDPTVTRGFRRAAMFGCGSYIQLNAFSFRSTDPKALYAPKPFTTKGLKGEERALALAANKEEQRAFAKHLNTADSDDFIREIAQMVSETPGARFFFGWGTHVEAVQPGRSAIIADIVATEGVQPECLAVTDAGAPKHPLYISYKAVPRPYYPPMENTDGEEN